MYSKNQYFLFYEDFGKIDVRNVYIAQQSVMKYWKQFKNTLQMYIVFSLMLVLITQQKITFHIKTVSRSQNEYITKAMPSNSAYYRKIEIE